MNTSTEFDQNHLWHPYSKCPSPSPLLKVVATQGSLLTLDDGQTLVDGMSSWWATIHGYNHPTIITAMKDQIETMPHIMFGGLTHDPAIELSKKLIELTPKGLNKVFFSDSGSVAMEVAIKMAMQYWISLDQPGKNKLVTVRNGYHGDTFATMAICDPDNGMHALFHKILPPQFGVPAPNMAEKNDDLKALEATLKAHHNEIAAMTIEPIVQGAGGMRFYRADYLRQAQALCEKYHVLFIVDEIATGFGRTGKLFGCNWAGISPDIMAVGKALTGGNISLAATLCQDHISETLNQGYPGLLMHGPTFMANPLACATAIASIEVLLDSPWQNNIKTIEAHFKHALTPLEKLEGVANVRVLGAIAVVELERNDLGPTVQDFAVESGIWLRPFGKLIYSMPAFNIPAGQLQQLTNGLIRAVTKALKTPS
jgi:adenosylmethionine-8-amino-7-oxononanoate aminotransferase